MTLKRGQMFPDEKNEGDPWEKARDALSQTTHWGMEVEYLDLTLS